MSSIDLIGLIAFTACMSILIIHSSKPSAKSLEEKDIIAIKEDALAVKDSEVDDSPVDFQTVVFTLQVTTKNRKSPEEIKADISNLCSAMKGVGGMTSAIPTSIYGVYMKDGKAKTKVILKK